MFVTELVKMTPKIVDMVKTEVQTEHHNWEERRSK